MFIITEELHIIKILKYIRATNIFIWLCKLNELNTFFKLKVTYQKDIQHQPSGM